MKPVEVVPIDLPRMLSDIIEATLATEPGIEVTVEHSNSPPLGTRSAPYVVVIGSPEGALPDGCRDLLFAQPRMKVLTVGRHGREVSVYQLRPHRTRLGEISPAMLVQAVKTAGASL